MVECNDKVWAIVVRVLNFCCGVLMIILGVLKFIDHDEEDNKVIYCIIFQFSFHYF